ncbi:MAG: sigma 54-dependent Fis family transcriptional regulator [Deltaproteobacteria bacterium]|nr:sigma 54-dependent Fis family transcriptional regulator [Deltaproteobacteria bacterium]
MRIEVLEGPDRGAKFDRPQERISVGTARTNDLVLTDPTVSRFHLELLQRGDRVDFVDHQSTNGTWIGTAAAHRGFLLPGTVVKLGGTLLRIVDGDPFDLALHDADRLGPVIGRSLVMRQLMARIKRVASSATSVVLLGETGVGKDTTARAIHETSPRAGGPFETVDAAALVGELVASELFGHEKGAFTGAHSQHIGAFERAHGGTLFIDEIGELPIPLQAALLGALERRSFRRVGGAERIAVDVRVVCASNRDLRAAVNLGAFRQDLFFRLAVVILDIPPLRDRMEDLPLLIEHFMRAAGRSEPIEQHFPKAAMEALAKLEWPGNVRELRNLVEGTLAMGGPPGLANTSGATLDELHAPVMLDISNTLDLPYAEARASMLERFERVFLRELMERSAGRVNAAARVAQMDRTYLGRLLKRHGFSRRAFATDPEDGE